MRYPMPVFEPLLKPGEVTALLGVSHGTLRTWADSGRLGAVRTPSGQRRYPQAPVMALKQILDGQRQEVPSDPA